MIQNMGIRHQEVPVATQAGTSEMRMMRMGPLLLLQPHKRKASKWDLAGTELVSEKGKFRTDL